MTIGECYEKNLMFDAPHVELTTLKRSKHRWRDRMSHGEKDVKWQEQWITN